MLVLAPTYIFQDSPCFSFPFASVLAQILQPRMHVLKSNNRHNDRCTFKLSICDLPYDALKEILLQVHGIDDNFHNIVDRFIRHACNSAFRRISFLRRGENGPPRNSGTTDTTPPPPPPMSEAETLRFYLAFYRSEFHHRLFATIHGVQLNATMEADFFGRLTLWECEQCTNVSAWLRSKVWPGESKFHNRSLFIKIIKKRIATCRALVHPSSYHPPDEPYARLGHSHYPVSPPLIFLCLHLSAFIKYTDE